MKIVTSYPVKIVSGKVRKLDYMSSIDGKNSNQVMAFQKYANSKGANLTVDGKWTRKDGKKSNTQIAYDKYGAEWEKSVINAQTSTPSVSSTSVGTKPETVVVTDAPNVPTGSVPTSTQVEEQKKKGVFWDKAKGVWVRAKDSGMLDNLANYFGLNTGAPTDPTVDTNTPPIDDKPKMSKGLKIGLIVGGVVLLGIIVFVATRPKSGK